MKKVKKYLIKIFPLEPYTFGSELGFSFKNARAATDTYFMCSKKIPEQTTVFGMIRYLLLKNENKLQSDFNYGKEQKEKIEAICGKESFSFAKALGNYSYDFGYLKGISPVFLMDDKASIYVKNPFCNVSEKKDFKLMCLHKESIETSEGKICLPEYKSKTGYAGGYLCIYASNKEDLGLIKEDKDFFGIYVNTGNMKNGESKKEALFKRETIYMNKSCFGVYISLDDNANGIDSSAIVYMGTRRSAFRIEAERVEENTSLEGHVKKYFEDLGIDKTYKWYYCLSDVLPIEKWGYSEFGIVEKKSIRNLETDYAAKNQVKRYRRSENQYNLISSGSVFWETIPEGLTGESNSIKKLKQVGYNYIIEIGGN